MLNSTNFQQIIVGNSGFGHPPPEVYVPIIISFIIGILTDPLPPDRDNVTILAVFFFEGFPKEFPKTLIKVIAIFI